MENLQQFNDYVYRHPNVRNFQQTLKVLQIKIVSIEKNELEFDLIGLKPFIANAIRQTILNEVPTMAIADVYFHKNTSDLFNCDYISQRLALIPIKADPDDFKFPTKQDPTLMNSDNCIVMNLIKKNTQPEPIKVYSKDIVWEPIGNRQQLLTKIEPLYPNIPILYLKNGEEISCRLHCIKGRGVDHMKFSPGFARYYFHSQITIKEPKNITSDTAFRIMSSFPKGVIQIETKGSQSIPVVVNERLDHHTRSFKNFDDVAQAVQVKYYRDHLIFNVESYGILDPVTMFIRALDILIYKYETWKEKVEFYRKKYEPEEPI